MTMTATEVSMMLAYETKAAIAAERARCAAVCRAVAARYRYGACCCEKCEGRGDGARECAEAIERGPMGDVDARAQTSVEWMAQAIAERDAARAEADALRERVIDAEAEASRWGDAVVAIGDALGMPGAGSAEIVAAVRELVGCQ